MEAARQSRAPSRTRFVRIQAERPAQSGSGTEGRSARAHVHGLDSALLPACCLPSWQAVAAPALCPRGIAKAVISA